MSNFKKLNLSESILTALEKKGYTTPTPIQIKAIPHLLEGKDLLGIAQTGTGKTAAFALPILDNLSRNKAYVKSGNMRTLILTPTRELASQIAENIEIYGENLGLKHVVIFGGVNINNQIKAMKNGFDIVIATPGRLLDLMQQGFVRFSQLEIFVLDEADRMLDMGFINDIKKIISFLPKERQTLFFSATMPKDIAVLADTILTNPVKVEVTPQATTVEKIDQKINYVDRANKSLLLKSILQQDDAKSVLVFSRTKHGANRIVQFLDKESISVAAIHGNKSQIAREKALNGFRQGEIKVLVATDIAARGIDIPAITHVINYDLPNDPESYVHRIGRTARAGREGIAISFCDSSEFDLLHAIEKVIKFKIAVDETHPFHGLKADPSTKTYSSNSDRRSNTQSFSNNRGSRSNRTRSENRPISYFGATKRKESEALNEKPKTRSFFGMKKNTDLDQSSSEPRAKFFNSDRRREDGERRPFNSDRRREDGERRPFNSDRRREDGERRPFNSDRRRESRDGERSSFFGGDKTRRREPDNDGRKNKTFGFFSGKKTNSDNLENKTKRYNSEDGKSRRFNSFEGSKDKEKTSFFSRLSKFAKKPNRNKQ